MAVGLIGHLTRGIDKESITDAIASTINDSLSCHSIIFRPLRLQLL